jgi:hypothetical protein
MARRVSLTYSGNSTGRWLRNSAVPARNGEGLWRIRIDEPAAVGVDARFAAHPATHDRGSPSVRRPPATLCRLDHRLARPCQSDPSGVSGSLAWRRLSAAGPWRIRTWSRLWKPRPCRSKAMVFSMRVSFARLSVVRKSTGLIPEFFWEI